MFEGWNRKRLSASVLAAFALAGGCSVTVKNQRVAMPGGTGDKDMQGTIVLVFSNPVEDLTVAVNGELVADHLKTRRLTIDRVELGYADVAVAGSSVERQVRVWVSPEKATFVPVAVARAPRPPNPVLSVALSLVALVISQSINTWLF